MSKVPNIAISPEKVFFIISKARQSDIEEAAPDLTSDFEDDDAGEGRVGKDTDLAELSGFLGELNVDEQIDLVALRTIALGHVFCFCDDALDFFLRQAGSWRNAHLLLAASSFVRRGH